MARKRDGRELSAEELRGFVLAYARGDVGDPVAAALLMAAYIRGLSPTETVAMTRGSPSCAAIFSVAPVRSPNLLGR